MKDTIEHRNGKHRCGVCWEYGWVLESEPIQHNEEHLAEMAAADDPRKDPDPGPDSPQPIVEAVADKPEAIVPAVVQIPHAPIALNTVTQGDCLDLLPRVASGSVDMVLCDLPYGTTQNKWDSVIPFERLWEQYARVCKPSAAIVLSAAQPFTSALVMSKPEWFKYDWVWRKPKGTGHLNAKKQPLRDKEDILVFYREQCTYNPQFSQGKPYNGAARVGKKQQTTNYGQYEAVRENSDGKRYPKQVLNFNVVGVGGLHPTQKPLDLWEYLIRTYTNEGDTVLDNCCGSGTTGVACQNTGRNFIQMELSSEYCEIAKSRLAIPLDKAA